MRTPRLAGLGLATVASATFALAGCDNAAGTSTSGTPAPTTSSDSSASASAADPAAVAALSQATAQLGTTSFKVTLTAGTGFKLTGGADAPNGNATAELTASGPNAQLQIKTLLAGQDLYAQVPGITKAGTWTHVDFTRLPEGTNIGLRPGKVDPVRTADLLGSATDVHATGGNSYAGTLDLTKAAGLAGLSQVTIDGYGTAASKVPFTAGLDAQGRLSELTVTPPQGERIDVLYTDYGVPVEVVKPAPAEITEAPDNFYTSIKGS